MNKLSYILKIAQLDIKELVREVVYTASIHTLDGMFMHEESNKLLMERLDDMIEEINTLRDDLRNCI